MMGRMETKKSKSLINEKSPLFQVLQEMNDGVLIVDQASVIRRYNRALERLVQLPLTALGSPCETAIPSEALHIAIHSVLSSGESFSNEITLPCGTMERMFQLHVMPLPDADGALNGCIALFHDMTDIRKTEKMRRDFVANVSHELRTPLSAIKGYAETLLDGALEDEQVSRDFVDVIYKHSIRLSQLVEDLLDLSKLESPDFHPELNPIALRPVMLRVHALAASNLSGKPLQFTHDIPEDLPAVLANAGNLEQVLTNLLDNAVKYTPAGGKVRLSARSVCVKERPMVQVDVVDTGIGIDRKHFPRLFERFYRVDKARSRDLGGTGLGLSICKHIVQYHGGEIWVESEPNKGTTFSFTLLQATQAEA
jgi:two-component system phosphate regulon sensor histidine kinase PhoR